MKIKLKGQSLFALYPTTLELSDSLSGDGRVIMTIDHPIASTQGTGCYLTVEEAEEVIAHLRKMFPEAKERADV